MYLYTDTRSTEAPMEGLEFHDREKTNPSWRNMDRAATPKRT